MDQDFLLPSAPRTQQRNPVRPNQANKNATNTNTFPFAHRSTDLTFDTLSGPPSSDPPLFSSDDFQPGLENYTSTSRSTGTSAHATSSSSDVGAGRKRRYRGTWWGEKVECSMTKKKRTRTAFKNKRDMDSGVWMMSSDDSANALSSDLVVEGEVSGLINDEKKEDVNEAHVNDRGTASPVMGDAPYTPIASQGERATRTFVTTDRIRETEAQMHARSVVNRCLEKGIDNVDLSYFNLEIIPLGLLQPLVQLTKEPRLEDGPFSEEAFTPLEPFLRLYLAQNRLSLLSREIFDLEGLKVLSLRQNKLEEIPCAIRKLTKLQDLNVAVNRLKYLPWELLGLMQTGDLKRLTVHPNPFIQLHESDIVQWHWDLEKVDELTNITNRLKAITHSGDANPQAWLPLHIATGSIKYLDMEGHPLLSPLKDDNQNGDSASSRTATPPNCSRAQSLRELSLQACLRSPQISHFLDLATSMDNNDDNDDDDTADYPVFVLHLLRVARIVKQTGDRTCSVCGRTFIIPRVEWVEWWDCAPYENGSKVARAEGQRMWPLPFLRRGCSWGCGPVVGGR